jgi:hypothetical protein
VDDSPKFRLQSASLVWSLIELGGVTGSQIVVHYVGDPPRDFRDLMTRRYGVDVLADPRRRASGATRSAVRHVRRFDGRVVLLDCDTLVTRPVLAARRRRPPSVDTRHRSPGVLRRSSRTQG